MELDVRAPVGPGHLQGSVEVVEAEDVPAQVVEFPEVFPVSGAISDHLPESLEVPWSRDVDASVTVGRRAAYVAS